MAVKPQIKANQLAKDLGLKSKDIVDIMAEKGIELKAQKALEPHEFDVLFDAITSMHQIDGIDDYIDGVTYIPSKLEKIADEPKQENEAKANEEIKEEKKAAPEIPAEEKTEEYIAYTGILKLKVVDNKLSKRDLETDTAYRALMDNEGQHLYDENSYAMYAISETSSEVRLEFNAREINSAIGWVIGTSGLQGVTSQEVIDTVKDFATVRSNYTDVTTRVVNLEHADIQINNSISTLSNKLTEVEETVANADVTVVKETVDQNVIDIADLKTKTSTLEGKVTSLENKDTSLERSISSNTTRIAAAEGEITKLKSADVIVSDRVTVLEGRANTISGILDDTVHEVDELQTRTGLLEAGFESQKSYVAAQLTAEIARAIEAEKKLENALEAEINRSTSLDESLQTQLNNINELKF